MDERDIIKTLFVGGFADGERRDIQHKMPVIQLEEPQSIYDVDFNCDETMTSKQETNRTLYYRHEIHSNLVVYSTEQKSRDVCLLLIWGYREKKRNKR